MDSKEIDYQLGLNTGIVDKKDNTKVFKVLLIIAGLIIIALLVTTIVLGVKYSSLKESSSKESSSNESSSPKSNDNYFTSKVFMVKPVCFGFNNETAETNPFQQEGFEKEAQENALKESGDFAKLLTENDITVIQAEDTIEPKTPDSIFPNNWFSTHEDGTLVLYPMYAENRRAERKQVFLDAIKKNFEPKKIIDLTNWEKEGQFLEGTGSLVLDRENKIAYACKSPRTSGIVFNDFCNKLGYFPVLFNAVDKNDTMIYHTNVLMCIGKTFAIICLDCIKSDVEKNMIIESLNKTNKKIIDISLDQLVKFAGNMLELKNKNGKRFLIMSDTAYNSLTKEQLDYLQNECTILHPKIDFIEKIGGGSARCMMAELF
jgi:hypothetical protein